MPNTVIVGSQWGDEGKAKVIDYLTEKADVIIRFQGGANAGHTVVVDGEKFVFHMVPSGIMNSSKVCLISNGVVFDAKQFLIELNELKEKNIDFEGRLFVSDTAHLVLPYHKVLDGAREASRKNGGKIGTTGRGIGPTYASKVSRDGIRVGEILDWEKFEKRVTANFNESKRLVEDFYGLEFTLKLDEVLAEMKENREALVPYIIDTNNLIHKSLEEKKDLLFEGAQGTFLDIDHGTYPFVTSSNTVSGAVCTGAGVGPSVIDHVVGIVKVYTTRVGNGPFPTELNDSNGRMLQDVGHEYGATTGRPRRCGWFDAVLLKKAVRLNGFTRLALTKLDVLNGFKEIKICTAYKINGEKVTVFPSEVNEFDKIEPVYETMPGWNCDLSECTSFEELPENARKYVRRLQELCYNVPILIVSIGPDRSETMEVTPI